jgi:hypothetical protein
VWDGLYSGLILSDGEEVTGNPFTGTRLSPEWRPFLFSEGDSAAATVSKFAEMGWRGQIVGGHGTGKSTLVHSLVPAIEARSRRVKLVTFHDGAPRSIRPLLADLDERTVLVIDGFEQLSGWNRWRVRSACRAKRAGLLVTTHQDLGLPLLASTSVDLATARQVFDRLTEGYEQRVTHEDLERQLVLHGGNLREALFALYDLFEERAAGGGGRGE